MLGALHRLKLRKHPSNHPNVHRCKLMSTGSPKGVVLAQLEKLFPGIRMPSARPRFSVIERERGRVSGEEEGASRKWGNLTDRPTKTKYCPRGQATWRIPDK